MAYACERLDYRLRVEGRFVERDRWIVHAVLEYGPFLWPEARPRVEAEARLELMTGISRESRLGRDLGASRVIVVVDGDREIAGYFEVRDGRGPDRVVARSAPRQAPAEPPRSIRRERYVP